jgi:2-dehydro-3-deoxygluconokinase
MVDIVALGEPMIEFNEEPDGRYRQGFGGDTSNAAVAAARLGARVRYLTQVGTDRFGDLLMALWQREEVDTVFVARHPTAATGVYVVNHTQTGHVFTYLRAGSAASRMTPADLPEAAFASAQFLHVSAISQAISLSARETVARAITFAKSAGAKISYDTNLRLRLWSLDDARATIAATAAKADILKTSIEDAAQLTGLGAPDAVADHYLAAGTGLVVVTLGADGVLAATRNRRETLPAFKVAAVDATGAGDCFAGALLARLVAGDQAMPAVRFANAAAALATTGYGAVAPLPTLRAVRELIAAQN